MQIKKLEICGFKSLKKLSLTDWGNFGILAGANGSGKSNIFDAMKFISICITQGLNNALIAFGGFEYIHCFRMRKGYARTLKFFIEIEDLINTYEYSLTIKDMDSNPRMLERVKMNGHVLCERQDDGKVFLHPMNKDIKNGKTTEEISYPLNLPIINITTSNPIYVLLSNVNLYRIDPVAAKNSSLLGWNSSCLDVNGQNISKVLAELEKDKDFFEMLNEFMSLVVPGLKSVATERQELEIRTVLAFKEYGLRKRFPAHLISDGTIYLLCLFTAVLHPKCQRGITLIEEPERGINPKPIEELIDLLRSQASEDHFIFVTTHNETVVRSAQAHELVFVYKEDGITQLKWGRDYSSLIGDMPLDTAWLANMFGSGLPW